jgi:hypothetical protein
MNSLSPQTYSIGDEDSIMDGEQIAVRAKIKKPIIISKKQSFFISAG